MLSLSKLEKKGNGHRHPPYSGGANVNRRLSQRQQEKAPERRPAHHNEEEGPDHILDHGKPDSSGDAGLPAESRFVEVV
jgi:hypothetical protein